MEERDLTLEEQQRFADVCCNFTKSRDLIQGLSLDDLRGLRVAIFPIPKNKNLEDRNEANYERIQPNTIYFVGVSKRADDFASLLSRCEATAIAIDNNGNEYYRLHQRSNKRGQRDMLRGYVSKELFAQLSRMIQEHTT